MSNQLSSKLKLILVRSATLLAVVILLVTCVSVATYLNRTSAPQHRIWAADGVLCVDFDYMTGDPPSSFTSAALIHSAEQLSETQFTGSSKAALESSDGFRIVSTGIAKRQFEPIAIPVPTESYSSEGYYYLALGMGTNEGNWNIRKLYMLNRSEVWQIEKAVSMREAAGAHN